MTKAELKLRFIKAVVEMSDKQEIGSEHASLMIARLSGDGADWLTHPEPLEGEPGYTEDEQEEINPDEENGGGYRRRARLPRVRFQPGRQERQCSVLLRSLLPAPPPQSKAGGCR